MTESPMVQLLVQRRKRLVASILGHAEREFFAKLNASEREEFRDKTLDSIDEFCDLVRDLLKISTETFAVNDEALDLLRQIHRNQQPTRR
jgi:hypothetical protein